MNKVLRTVLQALSIVGSACLLMVLVIAGALNEAVRPWAGVFFLGLVPCYLLLVKRHLDREQASEMTRTCTWSVAVTGSLPLLLIGMLLLLNSIPGGGELMRLFLFQPLDFLESTNEFMRYLLLFIAACILAGLVSGIRALYHRRHRR